MGTLDALSYWEVRKLRRKLTSAVATCTDEAGLLRFTPQVVADDLYGPNALDAMRDTQAELVRIVFEDLDHWNRPDPHAVTGQACWCCAKFALLVPAEVPDQGGGHLCVRCANSSATSCDQRHRKEQAEQLWRGW